MEAVMVRELARSYRQERSRLLGYIRSRVSNPEDAEDILHEVFVSAVNGGSFTQPLENMVAWLFTIARNKVIDWYRRKKLRTVSLYNNDTNESRTLSLIDLIKAEGIDVEQEHVRNMVMEAIFEAVEELPAGQKEVFLWQELEGRTFREIAETTKTSINTLLARKRYAVLFLRQRLKEIKQMLIEEV
jgi:RNA polymerase sigma factor (sigma-70 family)